MAIPGIHGHHSRIVARLPKSPTGIDGFDQITQGGLPAGRPTLVCGGAGCGKTLFALSFLVHGATRFDEPGVYMSFAPWESFESQRDWKQLPEFVERIGRVRSHCQDLRPSVHELVTKVE